MKTSLRAPTRYEAERIEVMLKLGCVACAVMGIPYALVECHHLLDGGVRMGHWFTLPLCAGHHRGDFTPIQKELLERKQLVAISDGRRIFAKVYGTEKRLWTRVQERLRLPAVWPSSKILPRRGYEMASDVVEVAQVDPGNAMAVPMGLETSVPTLFPRSTAPGARDEVAVALRGDEETRR